MAVRPYYQPDAIKRVMVALLDMFDNIEVRRRYAPGFDPANYDGDDAVMLDDKGYYKPIHVPIMTHFSESFANTVMNHQDYKQGTLTPCMGLRLNGISRDSDQTTTSKIRKVYDEKSRSYLRDVNPTSVIMSFTLSVYAETMDDITQLFENIFTYYRPWRVLRIKEFSDTNISEIERDVRVEMSDPSFDFSEENGPGVARHIVVSFPLKARAVLWPPMHKSELITSALVNFKVNSRSYGSVKADSYDAYSGSSTGYSGFSGLSAGQYSADSANKSSSIVVFTPDINDDKTLGWNVDYSSMPRMNIGRIPAGSTLTNVRMVVLQEFNDSNAYINVEVNGAAILTVHPYMLGGYGQYTNINVSLDTDVYINFDVAQSTTGLCSVNLEYT